MTNLPALSRLLVADAVRAALKEDLGRAGDITTQATIPETARAKAVIAAREDGVIAGLALAREAFSQIDAAIAFEPCVEDGAHVAKGAVVARIEAPSASWSPARSPSQPTGAVPPRRSRG